mgnify:CR=1 FL=1
MPDLMRKSLTSDPVSPILTEAHLQALDRRLAIILESIRQCSLRRPIEDILIDDGF